MTEEMKALLIKANEVKKQFKAVKISLADAVEHQDIVNYIDTYNKKAKEVAKKFGRRPITITPEKFLRTDNLTDYWKGKKVSAENVQKIIYSELLEFLEEVSDVSLKIIRNKIAEASSGKEKPWSLVKFIDRTLSSIDHLKKLFKVISPPKKFSVTIHNDCKELLIDIEESIETIRRYQNTTKDVQIKEELEFYLKQVYLRKEAIVRLYLEKVGVSLTI